MSGSFNLWKTNSPVLTFPSLTEAGKGLPAGWVSDHGDKRVQKQTNGDWTYVPHNTPLGMQPFFKAPGTPETVKLTPDDEMMGYLKSITFDDPTKQKAFTGNPKFVVDMLKKFGTGWLDKYHALKGKIPAAPTTTPSVTPAPPPPPSTALGPPEQAMKMLSIAADSKEAFAVHHFHKSGSLDATLDEYSKKYGIKYAKAFDEIEGLVNKGKAKGVWSVSGDFFDGGATIAFNVGTGPVISAPAIAATASAPSLTVKQTEPLKQPKAAKVKKPGPSTSTPVPSDVSMMGAPPMKGVEVPIEPKVIALAQKLGHGPDSDVAKILSVWRKRLQTGKPGVVSATAQTIASISGWGEHAAHQYLLDLLSKVTDVPGWDMSDFAVDSGATAPGAKKAEPAPTLTPSTVPVPTPTTTPAVITPPGLSPAPEIPSLSLDKAVSDMVAKLGYQMGAPAAVAVGMLTTHDGDIDAAAKGMAASLGWSQPQAFKVAKFVYGQMMALKAGGKISFEPPPGVSKLISPPGPRLKKVEPEPTPGKPVPDVLPLIPPIASLSYAGDAKTKLGGNKPKKFLKDEQGNLYLHKYGADQIRAAGGEVASTLAAAVGGGWGGGGTHVPVKAVEYEGDWGTVQPVVPNLVSGGLSEDPSQWTADDINQLLRERVVDWVASNHDSKLGNFIKTKKGKIYGIDKEQAFKFIGTDKLDLEYAPNPSPPIYNALFKAYADKKIDLNPNAMLPFIQNTEKVPDEDWLDLVDPYLQALPQSERDEKAKLILARKNSVRKDFEAFFTMLKKKRGEAGTFTFPGAAPPAPVVPVPATQPVVQKPTAGLGVLVPPQVPSLASLSYSHKANIGGAGEKHFFTDKNGKLWLLKLAANKTDKKPEPWKVAAQTLFAMVGKAVKPNTPPVGAVEYGGKPATIQPWLGDSLKTLAGVAPHDLDPGQKLDVAQEHVLDWLTSQHDTHGGNLVVLPDSGDVVGIDKEQGFKYLLPNPKWTSSTPEGDKLSVDYHPNAQYGEGEPYYNKFWKEFADGSMNFDPKSMAGAIAAVEKIPDDAYMNALAEYGATAFPTDAVKAALFYGKAMARKKGIRAEFESFITDLYKKRTKQNGLFTFATGWVPEGASAPTPAGLPSVPTEPPPAKPVKPTSPPHTEPVPVPTGFVAPPNMAFNKAVSDFGWTKGSVYYPALKQLQLYNNDVANAAKQLSYLKQLSPEVALKRVKYALKKLKQVGGWSALDAGSAPSASTATPVASLNPSSTGSTFPATVFIPGSEGEKGNQGVKLLSPSEAFKPPPPPPPPPVPEGFEPPPAGKMWEVKKASAFFGAGDGHLYKTKPPKLPDGTKDENSPNLVAKFQGTTISAVKEALGQVGVTPIVPLKEKAPYVVGVFAKTDWSKAQTSDKKLGVLVDLPPPPPPPSGKFTAAPQAGELKNADATGTMGDLGKINEDTKIGYGQGFRLGGSAVEHQSFSVQRRIDPTTGKPYYRFMFKLRQPFWSKLKGGTEKQYGMTTATYNAKADAFKPSASVEHEFSVKQWKSGDSVASLATNSDGDSYALKGYVICDVKPEGEQPPVEALRKLLKTMDPSVEEMVLHDPTPEEDSIYKLSALLWSAAPQEADALTEQQRNVPYLTQRLKALSYTQEQLDSLRIERVGIDQNVPVLPGRGKALQAKHNLGYVSFCCSSPERVLMQIQGGSVGIVQRLKHGFTISQSTTSGKSDIDSGGADYLFTKPGHKTAGSWENQWGTVEMVYDPSEFDRLDSFMHTCDGYGRTNGEIFDKRKTLENSAGTAAEICFRQGLNVNKLVKIRCQSEQMVPKLIKALKDAGITKINGMTPEELVVSGSGGQSFYKTFLAPGGY